MRGGQLIDGVHEPVADPAQDCCITGHRFQITVLCIHYHLLTKALLARGRSRAGSDNEV
ncbi:MAG: hypothetical protein M3343_04240 [Actinomycetota bacterium]|nr:hypothetical protein [Actinomycetota bacterium]